MPAASPRSTRGNRDWRSGAANQRLIADLLGARRDDPALFLDGSYEPLALTGARAADAIAFRRRYEARTLLVLAAFHTVDVVDAGELLELPDGWWGDTAVEGEDRPAAAIAGRRVVTWEIG